MHRVAGAPTCTDCCGSRVCALQILKDSTCALGCPTNVDPDFTFKIMADTGEQSMWFVMCSRRCYDSLRGPIIDAPGTHLVQQCAKCDKKQIDPAPEDRFVDCGAGQLLCKACSSSSNGK